MDNAQGLTKQDLKDFEVRMHELMKASMQKILDALLPESREASATYGLRKPKHGSKTQTRNLTVTHHPVDLTVLPDPRWSLCSTTIEYGDDKQGDFELQTQSLDKKDKSVV